MCLEIRRDLRILRAFFMPLKEDRWNFVQLEFEMIVFLAGAFNYSTENTNLMTPDNDIIFGSIDNPDSQKGELKGDLSSETDGKTIIPEVYNAPTVTNILEVPLSPSEQTESGWAKLYNVTVGTSNVASHPGFISFVQNHGLDNAQGALQFTFATALPTGTQVQLRLNGQILDQNIVSSSLLVFRVHKKSSPEIKYYEQHSLYQLTITPPTGIHLPRQITTPGGVGMIIVANIGGGDDGLYPGSMTVGDAFAPPIDQTSGSHSTQTPDEPFGDLKGNPTM